MEKPENTIMYIISVLGKVDTLLKENGAYIDTDNVVIGNSEYGMCKATITIALKPTD
jgi:hypothetical protein